MLRAVCGTTRGISRTRAYQRFTGAAATSSASSISPIRRCTFTTPLVDIASTTTTTLRRYVSYSSLTTTTSSSPSSSPSPSPPASSSSPSSSLPFFAIATAAAAATASYSTSSAAAAVAAASPAAAPAAPLDIVMYQYAICPYCNKVKALLDYLQIAYRTVEVDAMNKKQIAFSKDYRKVPIAMINGEQVNDSADIIDRIVEILEKQQQQDSGSSSNSSSSSSSDDDTTVVWQQRLAHLRSSDVDVRKWMEWGDRRLAVLLFPNICRTPAEAIDAFGYVESVPDVDFASPLRRQILKYAGGLAMHYMARGRIMKKYDIEDERQAMWEVIDEWQREVLDKRQGSHSRCPSQPDLADLCVWGVLRSIRQMQTWRECMSSRPVVAEWYNQIDAIVTGGGGGGGGAQQGK